MHEAIHRPVSGTSLAGHLQLRCDVRADGVPFISRQDFRAPIHIGKGHLDHGALVLNIANPTAGFFDGDRVDSHVTVGRGAHLVLGTPAASRVYQARSGKAAANHQHFHVEENAMLEWIPEPFIPHAGASYFQATDIGLHPTASLLFCEWLAPGRVARGEAFAYRNLRWELDLRIIDGHRPPLQDDGHRPPLQSQLVARERYDLRPENNSLATLRAPFPAAHYLSVYAAGRMTENWPGEELDALESADVRLGHGPLTNGVHVIRALCRDSLATRKLLEGIRPLLHRSAGMVPAGLGRIFS